MSTDSSQMGGHSGFATFLETHKGIAIGGGVVLLLIVAGIALRSKTTSTLPASSTADLSGLTGGKVYVPTQTSFSTTNIKQGAFSNDPNLITVTNSGNVTDTTTTNKYQGGDPPQGRKPPPPTPVPITKGGLIWDTRRSVRGGETLQSIAAEQTRYLRTKGMPGSMSITWHDLYGHNTDLINRTAQQHGYRADYWNWIFPGESLTVPRWG